MYKAIFVYTGVYDTIITNDGVFMMDEQTLYKFLNAPVFNYDFSDLNRGANLNLDNIWDTAQQIGTIVAYYDEDGNLKVNDAKLWKERMLFWNKQIQ